MKTWTAIGIVLAAATLAGAKHRNDGGRDREPHLAVHQCQQQFEQVIADGRGFGLAFVADQEGYPGPLHVLELEDRLRLSGDQQRTMKEMLEAMFAESRPAAARLLAAEQRLRSLFARGLADEASVRAALAAPNRPRRPAPPASTPTSPSTADRVRSPSSHGRSSKPAPAGSWTGGAGW